MLKLLLLPLKWLPWRSLLAISLLMTAAWLSMVPGWDALLPTPATGAELPPVNSGPDWMMQINLFSLWLIVVIAQPLLLLPLTLAALHRQSNLANAGLLLFYTGASLGLGIWLLWPVAEWLGVFTLCLLLGLIAFFILYALCGWINNRWVG